MFKLNIKKDMPWFEGQGQVMTIKHNSIESKWTFYDAGLKVSTVKSNLKDKMIDKLSFVRMYFKQKINRICEIYPFFKV